MVNRLGGLIIVGVIQQNCVFFHSCILKISNSIIDLLFSEFSYRLSMCRIHMVHNAMSEQIALPSKGIMVFLNCDSVRGILFRGCCIQRGCCTLIIIPVHSMSHPSYWSTKGRIKASHKKTINSNVTRKIPIYCNPDLFSLWQGALSIFLMLWLGLIPMLLRNVLLTYMLVESMIR